MLANVPNSYKKTTARYLQIALYFYDPSNEDNIALVGEGLFALDLYLTAELVGPSWPSE